MRRGVATVLESRSRAVIRQSGRRDNGSLLVVLMDVDLGLGRLHVDHIEWANVGPGSGFEVRPLMPWGGGSVICCHSEVSSNGLG